MLRHASVGQSRESPSPCKDTASWPDREAPYVIWSEHGGIKENVYTCSSPWAYRLVIFSTNKRQVDFCHRVSRRAR